MFTARYGLNTKYTSDNFRRRLSTTEIRVRSKIIPCEICGGRSGKVTGFFSEYFGFTRQYHSTNAPYSSSPACCSYQKDKRVKSGNLPENNAVFVRLAALGVTVLPYFLSLMGKINEKIKWK